MWARRVELIAGVLGGALGLLALGTALFAPLGMQCVDSTTPGGESGCFPVSLVQVEGLADLSFAITLFGLLSVGIALFTLWHVLTHSVAALVLLWVCTVLLYFATLLGALSIGLFFLPADVLALIASIAGTVAPRRRPAQV
jgi:hypothetical protein